MAIEEHEVHPQPRGHGRHDQASREFHQQRGRRCVVSPRAKDTPALLAREELRRQTPGLERDFLREPPHFGVQERPHAIATGRTGRCPVAAQLCLHGQHLFAVEVSRLVKGAADDAGVRHDAGALAQRLEVGQPGLQAGIPFIGGKIDVKGRDAGEFLDRLYTGVMSSLKPGRARYGVMCKADGMVMDDGVVLRLADDHFMATTTTGGAANVLNWMEDFLQTEWPDLDVWLTSVTEQWATVAVVGPRSREVMAALAPGLDVSQDAFRFMQLEEAVVAGIEARVARISFSGELAFEINVPMTYGLALWEAVYAAGQPFGITPYGTESMHVLRAEKGYFIVGQETDGTVTPLDLGLDWMIADKEFVGRRSLRRSDMLRADRKQLVGILPAERLPEGAQLVDDAEFEIPVPMIGHVTSSYDSAALGRPFGLALVRGGRERIGETIYAALADRTVAVEIVDPVIFDQEGARRDG